jgi:hypothetical protein
MAIERKGAEDMTSQPQELKNEPAYLANLEAAYGVPSQAGFENAVFYADVDPAEDLEKAALEWYQYSVSDLWERYGEDAWMGPWKEVYARKAGAKADIVAELRGITDRDARLSVPMVLDIVENAAAARQALSAAYDDPAVTELCVYNLGDGEAMSGLLLAAQRDTGEATFLVSLMD